MKTCTLNIRQFLHFYSNLLFKYNNLNRCHFHKRYFKHTSNIQDIINRVKENIIYRHLFSARVFINAIVIFLVHTSLFITVRPTYSYKKLKNLNFDFRGPLKSSLNHWRDGKGSPGSTGNRVCGNRFGLLCCFFLLGHIFFPGQLQHQNIVNNVS